MRIYLLLSLFLLLPGICCAEIKFIELQYRPAEELVPQVRELLDEGEKVTAAGSHLVLIADGESLRAAEQLIKLLDKQQINLLIKVRQIEELQQVGKDSSVAVESSKHLGTSISGGVGYHKGNSSSIQEQSLRLLEGEKGFIEVGQEIPYTEQWAALTGDTSGYGETTVYKNITTGFWISPLKVVGDKVTVAVEPYVANVARHHAGEAPQINYSHLSSRLQVPLGQWYPLGSQLHQKDRISRAIVSWRSSTGQADRELQIRIERVE